jgi:hypothetical protein
MLLSYVPGEKSQIQNKAKIELTQSIKGGERKEKKPVSHVCWSQLHLVPCELGTPHTDVQVSSMCTFLCWNRRDGRRHPICTPSGNMMLALKESLAQPAKKIHMKMTKNFPINHSSHIGNLLLLLLLHRLVIPLVSLSLIDWSLLIS